jgi:heme A synthase
MMHIRRFTIVTIGLTFALLLMGGLVHNTRSSLACPDWPLCFGSAFPKMEGGVLVEHSHRLVATSVGLCTMVLFALLLRRRRQTGERDLPWLGLGALVCVIFQGVLGGITVLYRLPAMVSTGHLATSLFFFSLLIYIAFRLRSADHPAAADAAAMPRTVVWWTAGAALVTYLQAILGAFMRHLQAGLACNTDLPLCRGSIWPTGAHPSVLIHVAHRLLGVMLFVLVLGTALMTYRHARTAAVRRLAVLAPVLVLGQVTLGVLSITSFLGVIPVTAHLGGAALLLADLVSLHLLARGRLGTQATRSSTSVSLGREVVA